MNLSSSSKRLLPITVFMGVLVSFIFTSRGGFSALTFGDSADYLESARSVFSNEGYYRGESTWPFFRPPGYPFSIAFLWELVGSESIAALKILNLFLHLFSTFLVFKLASIRFNPRISLIATSLHLFNPFALIPLNEVQTETITSFLFLSFISLIVARNTVFGVVALSFVSVFLIAVRPEYLIFLVITTFCILVFQSDRRKYFTKILILTISVILCLSWWGFQNKKATGDFILLTNAGSYFLWNGSTDLVLDNYTISLKPDPEYDLKTYNALQKEITDLKISWGEEFDESSLVQKSNYWFQAYTDNVKRDPPRYILKTLEKGVIFMRPFLNPRSHGLGVAMVSLFVLLPMTASVGYATLLAVRRKIFDPILGIMIIGFLSIMMVHMLQMPDQRYKMPIFVPLFAYSSGFVVYAVLQRKSNLKVNVKE